MVCVMMRGLSVLALLFVIATSPVSAANSPDGLPRPTGYPVTPTREYGPTPDCVDATTNTRVDCEWYGFAHLLYPTLGASCLTTTRAVLSNSSLIGFLQPYQYYYLKRFIFDTATNYTYCLYGCFNMGNTSPTPAGSPPPPSPTDPPAPESSPPPPAPLLFPPPPPLAVSTPPTTTPITPPGAAVTPVLPPAPPRPEIISLNGAGFVRPLSGIVSLVVSGALLLLNSLLC